ncbi:MAG TPA: hypothetical protein VK698_17770 [Kofleriaceae bacterium]|nr:hypothetical protein [Kofleriaceae bacterium]
MTRSSLRRAGLAGVALIAAALPLAGGARAAAAQPRPAPARPEPRMAGKYAATFQEVSNNCNGMGMSLREVTIELSQSGERAMVVTVPSVPIMRGVANRGGKFKADARRGKTAIQGVDGRFSVAGRVDAKGIQLLFIAEYYRGTKPMCTQSWNASGPRR